MGFVVHCIKSMVPRSSSLVRVRKEVEEQYMKEINTEMEKMVWRNPGCVVPSQYADAHGRIVALYPGTVDSYEARINFFKKEFVQILCYDV